ncbi:MAG: hypothetical protein QG672_2720 [Pseudomonadota bacterium]|nr:hypothetical protein [Pseudomonadota bacterium]
MSTAKEPQNQVQFDLYHDATYGEANRIGPYTSHIWMTYPRHLGFLLARYKFVAKMLTGKKRVLEVGCGDGFGMPVVCQSVDHVHGVDFEPLLLEDNKRRLAQWPCSFSVLDIVSEPPAERFDAAYSLDVIEHIPAAQENAYFGNICAALPPAGVLIVGTPNVTAEAYATEASRAGHINLKSHTALRAAMAAHFDNVFLFSMNDELVHTGYYPMAHYLFAVGVGRRAP